ncbi:SpaA isopeptide-forming pilin-related protein [Clostridium cellulovorans]|uniref:Cna B domain protein n=1 Tax=Clostridium cellulovorans (strain ATCC 35296 / DSM 3052 / OCM 3 / 743B) TaxID=573061 RepID=D9SRI1_CLOC7|nr:SpaA isopeptide-forming pilin-related protein [Clostridium cellulovorans]ADL52410.1 Cna B domain protein [Clostridium cellulovorans 743B]
MIKKKFLASTLVIVFLMQIFMSNFNLIFVKATEISDFSFITGVTIKDTNGNELGDNVGKSDEIHATYSWEIPNDKSVNAGDIYTMQLPKEIHIVAVINQPINDTEGNKIADMRIGTDNKVVITFTQYASENSNVSGYFFVDCHFKASEISNLNPVPIVFNITGMATPVVVDVNFDQPDPTVEKNGTYDPVTDDITWKVTVNKEGVKADNVNFEDIIDSSQEFIDNSVEVEGIPISYFYDNKSGKLSCDLGNITSEQVITFKTNVHNDLATKAQGNYNYTNTAKINYQDNGSSKAITSNTKTVPVTVKYISKVGIYDEATKQIDWTIKVNETGRTIANAKVIEDIPAGLKVIPGTIKVGDSTADTTVIDGEYYYNYIDNTSTSRLEYSLGNISGVKTFTFSTEVNGNLYNSNNLKVFNNIAYIVGDGIPANTSSNYGVGVQSNILQKDGIGYDASTGRITWRITVNKNKTNIPAGAVITDDIPNGQTYVANSVKLDGTLLDDSIYTAATTGDVTKTGTLSYTFSNSFSDIHVIEFQTQLMNDKHYKANYNGIYNNSANITATAVNENASGTQSVNSEIIKKTSVDYNYATREITWKIVVNKNAMPITNAIVSDEIPSGQEYVENSATIDDNSKGTFNSETDIKANNKIVYYFTGTINKTYTVTLKTRITDLSIFNSTGYKNLYNMATIAGDEIPKDGVTFSTASRSIQNSVVSKKSSYTNGNDYIDWIVESNNNYSIDLSGATITDNLQDGLSLDTDTVELYTLTVNPNGTLTDKAKVQLTKDNVSYDPATRKFVFTFPKDSGTGAYRLKFRTNVTKVGSYSNSVQFNGFTTNQNASSSSVGVWFSSGGGGGVGATGSITVVKVDKDDTSKKLSGAVFQLLDQYGNVKATSSPTGSDGTVLFNKLKFDIDYYVKELTAPVGYNVNSDLYKFQLHNVTDQKDITYVFQNEKIKGNIQLTKVDDDNKGLPGAEFTLYDATDTSYTNPLNTAISDSNGSVLFNNVPYGIYVIKETKAAVGYNMSLQVLTVNITEDGKVVQASTSPIINTKIKGNIDFNKTLESGLPLANAEFTLYDALDTTYLHPLMIAVSDSNGIVRFNNVPYGQYTIKETKAPTGYVLSSEILSAEISQEGKTVRTTPDTLGNIKIKGSIEFLKTGEDKTGIQGVEFTLYNATDINFLNPLKSLISDSNGIVRFENVEYGNYVIKETKPLAGYNPISQIITATITEDGKTVKATPDTVINNKIKGNIKLLKVGEDNKGIENAEFTLYSVKDTSYTTPLMAAVSDANGLVEFKNVSFGSYLIKETKAPVGYNLSTQICTAEINEEGKTIEANPNVLADTKIKGNIELLKVRADKLPLKGVEFTLYDATDLNFLNPLMVSVSGDNGIVTFNDVLYGNYTIKETKTITGYTLYTQTISVRIVEDGKTVKPNPDTIVDIKIKGTIAINKIDNDGNAVEGAEFAIYDATDTKYENPLMTAVSDTNGKLVFKDLVYGNYVAKEIKAPSGYQISEDILEILVKDDGATYFKEVRNAKILVSIIVKAVDKDGKSLPNTEFVIYDKNGKPIGKVESDDEGVVKFDNVGYGDYTIKQIKGDDGYIISDQVIPIKVDSPETRNLIVENQKVIPPSKNTNSNVKDKAITEESTKTDKATIEGLPKTGTYFDFANLLMVGVINILIGTIFIVRRKN